MTLNKSKHAVIKKAENKQYQDHAGLERLTFFSDAVFAIAMTLLALDIRLPITGEHITENQLYALLLSIWPKYLGYVVSFLVIGIFWIGHHRKFRYIVRYDKHLMFINLLVLMVISFLPFPTMILSEYGNKVATLLYALTVMVEGLLMTFLWIYASQNHQVSDSSNMPDIIHREILRNLIVSGGFLMSIGLAFINTVLAMTSWFFIALFSYQFSD